MGSGVYENAWGGREFENIKHPQGGFLDSSQACHRSDSAEIKVAAKANGWTPVNLACSGAKTKDILTDQYHAEPPQIKQLEKIANDPKYDIKTVVVSIGGNDLGFSGLISDLIQITATNSPTQQTWGNWLNPFAKKKSLWEGYAEEIPTVERKITATLNQITDVMRKAGYKDGSYRFVYQSYSNLFASGDKRYAVKDSSSQRDRTESPGVPLSNATGSFASSTMVPSLTQMTKNALRHANNKDIQYMDLTNAFKGHELSSTDTEQIFSKNSKAPDPATAEWVVPINSNFIAGAIAETPRHFESFHPNRFGQEAYGTCLTATLKTDAKYVTCVGQPGKPPTDLEVRESGLHLSGSAFHNSPQLNEAIRKHINNSGWLDLH